MQGDQKSGSQNPDPIFQEIVSHIQPTLKCESGQCPNGTAEHPADWYVKFQCGADALWCNRRAIHYYQELVYLGGTWHQECGNRHPILAQHRLNLGSP